MSNDKSMLLLEFSLLESCCVRIFAGRSVPSQRVSKNVSRHQGPLLLCKFVATTSTSFSSLRGFALLQNSSSQRFLISLATSFALTFILAFAL